MTNRRLIHAIQALCEIHSSGTRVSSNRKQRENPLNEDVPIRVVKIATAVGCPKTKRRISRWVNRLLWQHSSPAWFACSWDEYALILRLPLNDD